MDVGVFTDTYLPTVNGVSYTVAEWKREWESEQHSMDVFYPDSGSHGEGFSTKSVQFPFYSDFYLGLPAFPSFRVGRNRYDVIHAHTPFTLGLSGLVHARKSSAPFVFSYHTPIHEYADYLPARDTVERVSRRYQDWMFDMADTIIVPTKYVKDAVQQRTATPVTVISNGVDTAFFRPADNPVADIAAEVDDTLPTIGYAGRLGHEKNVETILEELGDMDANIIIGGDGPARRALQERARLCNANVVFPGFVDRGDLPALYSMFDVFAFPSPVETQGKAALEAIACGTPVVGANEGALPETIDVGTTGEVTNDAAFQQTVESVLDAQESYRDGCLATRDEISITQSVDKLEAVYQNLL